IALLLVGARFGAALHCYASAHDTRARARQFVGSIVERAPNPRSATSYGTTMRSRSAAAVLGVVLLSAAPVSRRTPDLLQLQPNPNTERAGSLRDGVLTIALEAKESAWRLNGATRPPMTIEAFSEVGKAPLMPGPLVRAAQGTEIHLSV